MRRLLGDHSERKQFRQDRPRKRGHNQQHESGILRHHRLAAGRYSRTDDHRLASAMRLAAEKLMTVVGLTQDDLVRRVNAQGTS